MNDGTVTAPPYLVVNTTLPRDPDLLERDHATAIRETLGEACVVHHDRHIPRHFEWFAPRKYGYKNRSPKYQKLKDSLGLPPLVGPNPKTSGALKGEVTQNFRVTKTQYRATLRMRLPFKGGTGRLRIRAGQKELTTPQEQILNRIAELSVITSDESNYLAKFIEQRYAEKAWLPGVPWKRSTRR